MPIDYEDLAKQFGGTVKDATANTGRVQIPPIATGQPGKRQLAYVNNNPGNIVYAGQTGAKEGKGGFAEFDSPESGYNALLDHIQKHAEKGSSLEDYIKTYAPESDGNDTESYIKHAEETLGVSRSTPLAKIDHAKIAKFQSNQESGTKVQPDDYADLAAQFGGRVKTGAPESHQPEKVSIPGYGEVRSPGAMPKVPGLTEPKEGFVEGTIRKIKEVPSTIGAVGELVDATVGPLAKIPQNMLRPPTQYAEPEPTSTAGKVAKQAASGVVELAEGLTSPMNAALLATIGPVGELSPSIAKVLSGGFGAQMFKSAYDQYPELRDAVLKEDWPRAAKDFVKFVGTLAMGQAAGENALSKTPKVESVPSPSAPAPEPPQTATPPATTARTAPEGPIISGEQYLRAKAGDTPVRGPAEESASVFQSAGPTYAELFEQADKLAEKRARTAPEVPETGVPEQVARAQDARERIARETLGKPWQEVSNPERLVIDELVAEGFGSAVTPGESPAVREYAAPAVEPTAPAVSSPEQIPAPTRETSPVATPQPQAVAEPPSPPLAPGRAPAAAPAAGLEAPKVEQRIERELAWRDTLNPEVAQSLAESSTRTMPDGSLQVLRDIPVESISPAAPTEERPQGNVIYPEKVQEYTEKPSALPVELRETEPGQFTVHDGHHRIEAAKARGEETVRAWVPEGAKTEESTHDFSSTQLNLPDSAATAVRNFGGLIPREKLAEDGLENEPHITVKYGLESNEPAEVQKIVEGFGPVTAKVGRLSVFKNKDADVLKLDVDSPQLRELNKKIAELPNADEHPEYSPHITVAYLKPGEGAKYVGRVLPNATGKTITFGDVTFSPAKGENLDIHLGPGERGPEAGTVAQVPVSEIHVNPSRFQFKSNVGQGGAGEELRSVQKFDPEKSGILSVWKDPADGKTYVVNGHNRLALAQRTGEKTVTVRYIDASNATEARTKGALINIAEGRGDAIDAAKVFRDGGFSAADLEREGISLKGEKARAGLALANLDPHLFSKVVSGDLPVERAAVIGEGVASPEDQRALFDLLSDREKSGKRLTNDQVAEMIRLTNEAPKTQETQEGLFGAEQMTRSLIPEKAEVSEFVKKRLAQDSKLFSAVGSETAAEKLAGVGNVIKAGENAKVAARTAQARALYDKLSTVAGPVNDALDAAATALADGENSYAAKESAYRAIRSSLLEQAKNLAGEGKASIQRPEGNGPGEANNAGAGEPSLFGAGEAERVAAEAVSDREKLQGQRLTAQLNSPLTRAEQKLKPGEQPPQTNFFEETPEKQQRGMFDTEPPPEITAAKDRLKKKLTSERGSFSNKATDPNEPTILQDLRDVGRYYIDKGVTDFSAWTKAMIEDFGDAIRPALDKIWNELEAARSRVSGSVSANAPTETAPIRAAAPPAAERITETPERVITSPSYDQTKANILKSSDVSEPVKAQIAQRMGEWEKDNPGRRVVSFQDIRNEAAKIDPRLLEELKVPKEGDTLDPAVRFAARETVNGIEDRIFEMRKDLEQNGNSMDPTTIMDREKQIERLENESKRLLDILIPTRSQDGRNLVYHRMMAQKSFDADYWMSRAKRAIGLPPAVELPEEIAKPIRKTLAEGRAAEAAAIAKVRGEKPPIDRTKLVEQSVERRVKSIEDKMAGKESTPSERALTQEERKLVDSDPRVMRARRDLALQLMKMEKSGLLDTINAVRRAGLLTGIRTHLRNIGGNAGFQVLEELNRVPASIVDSAIALKSGRRTVEGMSPRAVARSTMEAATRGIKEASEIMSKGQSDEELAKFETKREMNSGSKALDAYVNFVFRTMSAEDRVFRVYAYERSLQEQMKLAKSNEPTEAMRQQAIADAEFSTFNNQNLISQAFSSGKANLRNRGPAGKAAAFLADMVVPFARTPANILARVIDYSGGGLVKAGIKTAEAAKAVDKAFTPEQQRYVSLNIARGLTGPALIYAGWQLAKSGMMTGTREDQPGQRNTQESAGRSAGAIKLGDKWYQLSSFSPVGNLLTIGASLERESTKGIKDEAKRPENLLKIGTQTVMQQPMLSGMQDVVEGLMQPGARFRSTAGSMAGSFVPTAVADAASLADESRRDVRSEDTFDAITTSVMSRLPGARNLLPERRDIFGKVMPQQKTAVFDPTLSTEAKESKDPVLKELVDRRISISYPSRKQGESLNEYRLRSEITGKLMESYLRDTIESNSYSDLPKSKDDESRTLMIEDAVRKARAEINRMVNHADYKNMSGRERIDFLKEIQQQMAQ